MSSTTPPMPSAHISGKPGNRSGFMLIMALVLIFLIFAMAITYLRTMRSYSFMRPSLPVANSRPVANQLIQDLAVLIGADGQIGPGSITGVYEPYDYPWTCARMNAPYRLSYPTGTTGTGALGDPRVDDAWLAPLEAEGGQWTQVSNPFGSFLVYTDASLSNVPPDFATRDRVPMDAPAGAPVKDVAIGGSGAPTSVTYQSLSTSDPRLVDTDGDGTGDALWLYPKDSWQQGVRYVAAVRVVDLSGMLNLNTALGQLASAPNTTSGTPRKGEGPYEIDASLAPMSLSIPGNSFLMRQSGVAVPSGRGPAAWTNWDYWWAGGAGTQDNGVSSAAAATVRYGLTDEIQLRDYANQYTVTPFPAIRQHYSGLKTDPAKRAMVTTLGGVYDAYAALPYSPDRDPNGAAFCRARRPFDIGGNQNNLNVPAPSGGYPAITGGTIASSFTNGSWWDQAQFWHDGDYGVTDFLKGIDASAYSNAAMTTNTDNDLTYPFPAGFRFALQNQGATWSARPLVFQRQMACNIAAALGRDNIVRRDNFSEWAGWEPLPVLTEFYAQMPYVMMSPSFLPATPTTAVVYPAGSGRNLADFTAASQLEFVLFGGGSVGSGNQVFPASGVYFFTNSGTDVTAQVQFVDGSYIKCCKIQLTQPGGAGSDIVGTVMYAKYAASAVGLGYNFDTGGTAGGIATAYNAGGYGVSLGQATTNASTGGNYSALYWNTTTRRSAAATPSDIAFGATDWRSQLSAGGASCGVGSYAFELANPYPFPVRLCNLRFEFKRYDYGVPFEGYAAGGINAGGAIAPAAPANMAHGTSVGLATYIDALGAAPSYTDAGGQLRILVRDSEGYWVLRPQEKIVFYRNGFDGTKAGGAARAKPFGGSADISGLISPNSCYKVDLGSDPAVPDLNGHPQTWKMEYFEIQCRNQDRSGSFIADWNGNWDYNAWVPWQHVVYPTFSCGWDTSNMANQSFGQSNIPAGRQGSPGDLVYRQLDIRTFGVLEKLDCLQARPPKYPETAWQIMPRDLGDFEYRTNYYDGVAAGTLSGRIFPNAGTIPLATGWNCQGSANVFFDNTATTLALGSSKGLPCWQYDNSIKTDPDITHPDRQSISALGRLGKVGWEQPGPDGTLGTADDFAGGPNGLLTAAYGTPTPPALTNRQRIRDEVVNWNYVGIPGEPAYAGTFPELTAANNANRDIRNNTATPSAVKTRRDGFPRTLDLLKVPLISNFVHYPGITGNAPYRGLTGGQNWGNIPMPSTSPWIGSAWQNTLGDALNFYLMKDTSKLGLRGLCLRTDAKWFDWPSAGSKYKVYNGGTAYPLDYADSTPYLNGMEALYNGEIYIVQNTATSAALPAPIAANVGTGRPWALSNGPYARASQFWQLSWGEILASRWNVDDPKWMGKTGAGGDNWIPGKINVNTAPKAVLQCLSLPTGIASDAVADRIIQMRQAPVAGASVAGGSRQGLALISEAFGSTGLKSYSAGNLASANGTGKFYTTDTTFNLETLSWLPQQASCRSDAFCAYIVVQGYRDTDFTAGPVDVCRAIALFSRNPTSGGAAATVLGSYFISRRKATDGDANDWYTP